MLLINDKPLDVGEMQLSDMWEVKPEELQKVVTFRLNVPFPTRISKDQKPAIKPTKSIPAFYTARRLTGQAFTVRYCRNAPYQDRDRNGNTVMVYDLTHVVIEKQQITFKVSSDIDLYLWLKNHPQNSTNPFYSADVEVAKAIHSEMQRNGKFMFYEVEPNKTAKQLMTERAKTIGEEAYLLDENKCPNSRVAQLYAILNLPSAKQHTIEGNYDHMRNALIETMKANYAAYQRAKSHSGLPELELYVEAKDIGIVVVEEGMMKWGMGIKFAGNKGKDVLRIVNQDREQEEVLTYMKDTADGNKFYEKLKEEKAWWVKQANKA